MSPGIMVCVTLILKTFEYVHLIILLHEETLAFQNHPSTSHLKHLQKSIALEKTTQNQISLLLYTKTPIQDIVPRKLQNIADL
jgi:hypothetical protein